MALAANALTTFATCKAEISGVLDGDQATVERLINVASEAIAKYCGRDFHSATVTERLRVPDSQRLILARPPLASITSIAIDGSTVSSDDYAIEDADLGWVWADEGWGGAWYETGSASIMRSGIPNSGKLYLVATYAGGFVTPAQATQQLPQTLPYELEEACIRTVAGLWRRRGVDLGSAGYGGENEMVARGNGGVIPGPVLPSLRRYQRLA